MLELFQAHPILAAIAIALAAVLICTLLIFAIRTGKQISGLNGKVNLRDSQRAKQVPTILNQVNWASFERTVEGLITVIVVTHEVTEPDGQLLNAVVHNLRRRVRYRFLVSQSSANAEIDGWYGIFEDYARRLELKGQLNGSASDAVQILKLPYDWDDFPFVFYLLGTRSVNKEEVTTTVAFRGQEQKKGICSSYKVVPPEEAQTLARVLMEGAPGPITDTMRQAVESNFERPLSDTQTQAVDVDLTRGQPA